MILITIIFFNLLQITYLEESLLAAPSRTSGPWFDRRSKVDKQISTDNRDKTGTILFVNTNFLPRSNSLYDSSNLFQVLCFTMCCILSRKFCCNNIFARVKNYSLIFLVGTLFWVFNK